MTVDQELMFLKSFGAINLALLKDTGWWAEINEGEDLADPMIWGKNEGCTFLEGTCDDLFNSNFNEFQVHSGDGSCDFYSYGYGKTDEKDKSFECHD